MVMVLCCCPHPGARKRVLALPLPVGMRQPAIIHRAHIGNLSHIGNVLPMA
jgi:hypothetical protein